MDVTVEGLPANTDFFVLQVPKAPQADLAGRNPLSGRKRIADRRPLLCGNRLPGR